MPLHIFGQPEGYRLNDGTSAKTLRLAPARAEAAEAGDDFARRFNWLPSVEGPGVMVVQFVAMQLPDATARSTTVDAATGDFELAATVPSLPGLPGMENVADAPERQAVPTGVAVTDDGTVHIGLLSEFWPEGAPSIVTLGDDGTLAAAGGPLGFNVVIAIGPDGLIYASQLFSFSQDSPEPGPGSVVRITADGEIETVMESVMMPHGIAFDPLGNMFVAINSLVSGPGMAGGQVIRIDGVAVVG